MAVVAAFAEMTRRLGIGAPSLDRQILHEIDPLLDPRWSEFIERNERASVFHGSAWLDAVNRTYGHRPAVLTTCAQGAKLENGLVFCRVNSWLTGKRLVSLPFSDYCEPLADSEQDLQRLLAGLGARAKEEGCRYAEVRFPTASAAMIQSWPEHRRYYLHRLDLRPGTRALFRNFHRSCIQRRIRHAEREGVLVKQGRDPEMIRTFYDLVLQTRRRQGVPPQPTSWFRNLLQGAGGGLIWCAYKDGRPVAAILTLRNHRSLVYKYGASDARFHKLGAIPYLFWHAIQHAVCNGLEELDMGRTDSENPSLALFKERWGARCSTISCLRWPSDTAVNLPDRKWSRLLGGVWHILLSPHRMNLLSRLDRLAAMASRQWSHVLQTAQGQIAECLIPLK